MISRILNFNQNPNSQRLEKHVYSFLDQNSPIFLDLLPSLLKILISENFDQWWKEIKEWAQGASLFTRTCCFLTPVTSSWWCAQYWLDLNKKTWDFYISSPKKIKFFCILWWLKCQKSSYTLGFRVYERHKMESHLCSLLLSQIADCTELKGTHNIEPCILQKLVQIRTFILSI